MAFAVAPDAVLAGEVAVAIVAAWAARTAARPLRQSAVVVEILVGVALGPSLLGLLPGDPTDRLFPASGRGSLTSVAELGLLLFMFAIGWELDVSVVRARRTATIAMTAANFVVPFAVGAALAFALYPAYAGTRSGHRVTEAVFVVYIGVALAITAFPVLARILGDSPLRNTPVGQTAMAMAAGTDLCGWLGLALVVIAASATGSAASWTTLPLVVVYLAAMFLIVRPLLRMALAHVRAVGSGGTLPLVVAAVLASSYVSSAAGLHAAFGAFLLGLVMPRDSRAVLMLDIAEPLERTGAILMPVYFVATGLSADFHTLGWAGFGLGFGVVALASTAKIGAVAAAARICRTDRREALILGILMNTRGLTEIVVLDIGLSIGIINAHLFTALLLMAVATTAVTTPVLHRLTSTASPVTPAPWRPGSRPDRDAPSPSAPARTAPSGSGHKSAQCGRTEARSGRGSTIE